MLFQTRVQFSPSPHFAPTFDRSFAWQATDYFVLVSLRLSAKRAPNVAWAKWGYTFIVFYTYILKLNNGKFYIGSSKDLRNRLKEHNSGRVSATKSFTPCVLVYYSAFLTLSLALHFEKYLKTSSGFAFRNKHFI